MTLLILLPAAAPAGIVASRFDFPPCLRLLLFFGLFAADLVDREFVRFRRNRTVGRIPPHRIKLRARLAGEQRRVLPLQRRRRGAIAPLRDVERADRRY